MGETIKTYTGPDVGASQCLVTLESFIGDMDNAELADDSTVDTSDAVTAINGLVWSLERREARINQLGAALEKIRWLEGVNPTAYKIALEAINDEQDASK